MGDLLLLVDLKSPSYVFGQTRTFYVTGGGAIEQPLEAKGFRRE
jgi:hypothetical protein